MSNSAIDVAQLKSLVAFWLTDKSNSKALPPLHKPQHGQRFFYRRLIAALISSSSLVSQCLFTYPAFAETKAYCQLSPEARSEKENLLKGSLKGDSDFQTNYKTLVKQHAEESIQCHSQNWPPHEGIWLRLYPCDLRPGVLDEVLDRIVNRGYNQINVEVFGNNGQVLLPQSDNPTPWPSVVRSPGYENIDLLAQVIQKGHERGLQVYAWMYTINFGYNYSLRPERESVVARNGYNKLAEVKIPEGVQAFVDPYNQQAKIDYYRLVQEVVKRHPDGILLDYVRYPRGMGSEAVVSKVQDLWIYGDAARAALFNRAMNNKGRELINRFLLNGFITAKDIEAIDKLYPQEGSPLWQGRNPTASEMLSGAQARQPLLQWDLWQLCLAHAVQGILDFVNLAILPAQQQGIKVGAVFFPDANKVKQNSGQTGFDSRLQAWEKFPTPMDWYFMTYSSCGNTSCIEDEVKQVLYRASPNRQLNVSLAGIWGQSWNNHPPLEVQMAAIHRMAPQINSVSHFVFSWQEPQLESERKYCQLE